MSSGPEFAKHLRQHLTDEERFVWSRLRNRRFAEFKFRRQVRLGKYFADFVCQAQKLILELDGGQHTLQREYDDERTRWLNEAGYRVIRFWNYQIPGEWEAIEEYLWQVLHRKINVAAVTSPSPPAPLPPGERGDKA